MGAHHSHETYTPNICYDDFMEITLARMIDHSIDNINKYLESGHKQVNASEIMAMVYAP